MLAALIVSLAAAAITAGVKFIRGRLPKSEAELVEDFPLRLTCRDETEFDPGSGYREGLQFEVFNHSDKTVRVRGFGLRLSMAGPGADWVEYQQARQHPPIDFPVPLDPNDALEGYIDHESLGEDLHQRGLVEYVGESAPYVDVIGFGVLTTEPTTAAAD